MKESEQFKRQKKRKRAMQSDYFFGRYNKVCDNRAVGVGAQDELTDAHATGCGAQADRMKVTRVTSVKIRWLRKTWSQSNGSNKTSGLFEGTACCRKVNRKTTIMEGRPRNRNETGTEQATAPAPSADASTSAALTTGRVQHMQKGSIEESYTLRRATHMERHCIASIWFCGLGPPML